MGAAMEAGLSLISLVLIVLACIPAMIARSKGRSLLLWYLYSFLLFPLALVHALLMKDVR